MTQVIEKTFSKLGRRSDSARCFPKAKHKPAALAALVRARQS
jgi:hypothetical protein